MKTKTTGVLSIMSTAVMLILTGCEYNNLITDVKEFNTAVSVSVQSLKNTYSGVNDIYRKTYLLERRFDATKNILAIDSAGKYSNLVYTVDPQEIRARELALQAITEYSAGLAVLAGSDAPERVSELAAQLSQRIVSTSKTLSELEPPNKKSSRSFDISAYSGPIADIAKITADHWVRGVQSKELKKSISKGSPKAIAVLKLLKSNIKELFVAAYEENTEMNLIQMQVFYNQNYCLPLELRAKDESIDAFVERKRKFIESNKDKLQSLYKDKDRIALLNELDGYARELERLQLADPEPIIDSLIHANEELLNYANKGDKGMKKGLLAKEDTEMKDIAVGEASAVANAINKAKSN